MAATTAVSMTGDNGTADVKGDPEAKEEEAICPAVASVCGADGCKEPGTKFCSRCGKEAYCSAECQRKAWRSHKLVCQRADTKENEISELLKAGRLYSARERLQQLPKANSQLSAKLDERLKAGIYSEIVENRLRLDSVPGFGKGYVAAKDLAAGEVLFFDTSFAWAPVDGDKEPHFIIAEKAIKRGRSSARRTNAIADAQADFFYDCILKSLPLKGGMERAFFEEMSDPDMREQMLTCSIAEGCSLWCSEEPGFMALYAAAAWFNHSCAPNATIESSRSSLVLRAVAPIPQGSEVTISYLPLQLLDLDAAKRRQRLQGGRGFDCRCTRCSEEGVASACNEEQSR
mmetsp:Transcript_68992/g.127129  ORF Transcript_68992/g.127129 Transcript_68992/m.127129 type:complete len:345 (-) Transcript_68992:82-1116(-)